MNLMSYFSRVFTLVVKELQVILQDKKIRVALIVPPIVQLLLFANAATLEVKNVSIVAFNQDTGWYGNELVNRVKGSPYFKDVYRVQNKKEFQSAIDNQRAIAGLNIQQNFSRELAAGDVGILQIILDGRKSNSSQIVQGYLSEIVNNFNTDILARQNIRDTPPIAVDFRSWYNPNLDYTLYTVPQLIAILSMIVGLIVTALSVAREREMGTFDQLMVSPLHTWEILVGKMLPALIVGLIEATIIMILAMILYDIPFRGSFLLFYFSLITFVIAIIGVGLFISSFCQTQQQSILGVFVFILPTMLLSGFATPIENMPMWLQPVSKMIPITYLFEIIKGLFLKDVGFYPVLMNIWPMALIALFTLSVAGWMFKKKLT